MGLEEIARRNESVWMEMKNERPKVCIHQIDASICHLHALFRDHYRLDNHLNFTIRFRIQKSQTNDHQRRATKIHRIYLEEEELRRE